jgi:hypothetical protein
MELLAICRLRKSSCVIRVASNARGGAPAAAAAAMSSSEFVDTCGSDIVFSSF